ncbi:tetratricopeptide repeat protein [Mesoterricola silvestris]|uniref:Outer membrane lipoprotein BamD-like domain-containing protein n=1 Tax=Mesoterricola silvestris TaxID=2927979 RepID=A0AA48GKX6_9BACT|nr:tetratricopeptide repeat protein [Mesoterricola silvestris]BDU74966.1 hypothetical protein METEAL_41400 [Mesoterricola silvestris]
MIPPVFTWALLAAPAPEPIVVEVAVREAPADALLREAKNLRYAQRWFEAAAAYRKFLAVYGGSPRAPEARFWLAASLESDQRWDEAAEAYTAFLQSHPDQRLLGKEARMNRVRCWGIRQGQDSRATAGLLEALRDPSLDVQVAAALQLAKVCDPRAAEGLRKGLQVPGYADACASALSGMGLKAVARPDRQARFLVIRIREAGKPDTVTIRLALSLARAVGNYLTDAQIRQARSKGFDLESITDQAAILPKGSVLLSVDDAKSSVQVTVE